MKKTLLNLKRQELKLKNSLEEADDDLKKTRTYASIKAAHSTVSKIIKKLEEELNENKTTEL